ncbi:MAG TPA: hypothetical protein VHW23_14915 [Kofleriaceae bacterium]|jgi:hypothetical protein|nr:hypothetical protein [Kofleriaceae bacterium]
MEAGGNTFVGRADSLKTLQGWLRDDSPAHGKTRVGSISGSAGIGKTFLLDHALRETDLRDRRYTTLRVAAATNMLPTLARVVEDLAASAKVLSSKTTEFPKVTECRHALEWMDRQAQEEVERGVAHDTELAKAVAELYGLARGLVQFVSLPPAAVVKAVMSFVQPKHVEHVVRLVQKAIAYQTEKPRGLRGRSEARLRNRLRNQLEKTLAEALVADLGRALSRGILFPKDEADRGRLLLVVDDYERLSEVAGDFMLRHLVPMLAQASFDSVIVVLGRDRLVDTHPGWRQHCQPHLLGDIALAEFTHQEAEQYVRGRGVTDPEKVQRIVRDTAGYPFLLESEVDDELHGQSSALARELFVERTTQWMSPQQKKWAIRLAFLDEVSIETIPRVLPKDDSEAVLAWFKREASLRAPTSERWTMRPMIRTKIREHVRNDSQAMYDELTRAAQGA